MVEFQPRNTTKQREVMTKILCILFLMVSFLNAGVWEKLQSFGDEVVPSESYDEKQRDGILECMNLYLKIHLINSVS